MGSSGSRGQDSGQGLGRQATGCGATAGLQPKCDFSCTGCYLGSEANRIPPLPLSAVLAQLDLLRRHLGPKSNVQITDGEVTLRPVEELITVLHYARSIGTVPMVMTHGDTLREVPGLLDRLMVEGLLTEISIHIDITQRGRQGHRSPQMTAEELETERGQARLDACVFRVPYRGEMVPMCRMNAGGVRDQLYAGIGGAAAEH